MYEGEVVGEHRLDMVIDRCLIIENKTVRDLDPVCFNIVRSYMKATDLTAGLILNFAKARLGVKRVYPNPT